MSRIKFLLICGVVAALSACSNDDERYPDLITDFVVALGDDDGNVVAILTDDGVRLAVDNTVTGIPRNARVRSFCSYAPTADSRVAIYNIIGIPLLSQLKDDVAVQHHPTGVAAVWQSGGYVNMHLLPKTYGGHQKWAFAVDSMTQNAAGSTTHHLSLYHDQGSDAEAYSDNMYLCIHPDSLATPLLPTDSLRLAITTYDGVQTWQFPAPTR